jgi:prolyl oligopeptidase
VGLVVRKKEETLYYSFTNYTTPGTTYSFKAKEGNQQYIKTKVDFKSEDFESKQVFILLKMEQFR